MMDLLFLVLNFLTRQLKITIVVILAKARHAVKRQRYPDGYWILDQVQDDEGWSI
jgi:hypothetical protein